MSAPDGSQPPSLSLPDSPARRRFLLGAVALSGAAVLELTGCVGPAATPSPPRWVRVDVTALTMNRPAYVDLPLETPAVKPAPSASPPGASSPPQFGFGGAWLVLQPDGTVTAFDPRCTHQACLYDWDGPRGRFVCRCHSGEFGLDGKVLSGPPPRPLARFKVREGAPGTVEVAWQDVPG